jgi:hypothetical protein
VKIIGVAIVVLAACGCVPNLDKICPYKTTITQGVFGEIVDSSGNLEESVEVDFYTIVGGTMSATPLATAQTGRAGYQFDVNPSMYYLCAKTVCTPFTQPTGLVELSALDGASGLAWGAPVANPPAQTIGPCTWGGGSSDAGSD